MHVLFVSRLWSKCILIIFIYWNKNLYFGLYQVDKADSQVPGPASAEADQLLPDEPARRSRNQVHTVSE